MLYSLYRIVYCDLNQQEGLLSTYHVDSEIIIKSICVYEESSLFAKWNGLLVQQEEKTTLANGSSMVPWRKTQSSVYVPEIPCKITCGMPHNFCRTALVSFPRLKLSRN